MKTKGIQTQEKMLAVTLDLLEKQGFHNTGLQQILSESGTPRGSLYFHFPGGKDQLTAAALSQGAGSIQSLMEQAFFQAPSLVEAIHWIINGLVARMESSDYQKGCPIATVALEVGDDHPEVQQVCRAAYQGWTQAIVTALQKTGWSTAEAQQYATVTLSMIEGALILAKVARSSEPLRNIIPPLTLLLSRNTGSDYG